MAELPIRTAGARLPSLSITWQDESGNARTLTGTITANMTNTETGTTAALTGTFTADADQVTNKGVFVYAPSAADVATPGKFIIYFLEDVSGSDYINIPLDWTILPAPTP